MNLSTIAAGKHTLGILLTACAFVITGCVYDVPITAKATRKIDDRLIGKWTSQSGKDSMQVVKLDDFNFVVLTDGKNFYRAYHSDVGDKPFVSVQILDEDGGAEPSRPKYAYWSYRFSDDGVLHVRIVNDKIVPDSVEDSASVQKLLKENLQNPSLFTADDTMGFIKQK